MQVLAFLPHLVGEILHAGDLIQPLADLRRADFKLLFLGHMDRMRVLLRPCQLCYVYHMNIITGVHTNAPACPMWSALRGRGVVWFPFPTLEDRVRNRFYYESITDRTYARSANTSGSVPFSTLVFSMWQSVQRVCRFFGSVG